MKMVHQRELKGLQWQHHSDLGFRKEVGIQLQVLNRIYVQSSQDFVTESNRLALQNVCENSLTGS